MNVGYGRLIKLINYINTSWQSQTGLKLKKKSEMDPVLENLHQNSSEISCLKVVMYRIKFP